jgi:hypothetical protein
MMKTRLLISIILIFLAIFSSIQILDSSAGARSVVGTYTSERHPWELSLPGQQYILTLHPDRKAEMKTDFLEGAEDYVETGSWRDGKDGVVNVMLDGRADGTIYDAPVLITFTPSEGKLIVVEANNRFIVGGAVFERITP